MMRESQPRQITSWQEAELNALEWMRAIGFADARLTKAGADEGLDIRSSRAVAQVKYEARDVGRPYLQQLVGARGRRTEMQLLFFTGAKYTEQAIAYANELDIALFHYKLDGRIQPINASAVTLSRGAGSRYAPTGRLTSDDRRLRFWMIAAAIATPIISGPGWQVLVVWAFTAGFLLYLSKRGRP
jgi:Restriction endonuclease